MQQWEQREKVGPVESFGDRRRGQKENCNNIYAMYDCFFLLEPTADLYSAIRLCSWEPRPTKAQPLP
jgi:hypothetical protein